MKHKTILSHAAVCAGAALICMGLCSCGTTKITEGPVATISEPDTQVTEGPVATTNYVGVDLVPVPKKIETKTVKPDSSPLRHDQPDTPLYKP